MLHYKTPVKETQNSNKIKLSVYFNTYKYYTLYYEILYTCNTLLLYSIIYVTVECE